MGRGTVVAMDCDRRVERVRANRRGCFADWRLRVSADRGDDSGQPVAGRGRRPVGRSHGGDGGPDSRHARWLGGALLGTGAGVGWGKMGAVKRDDDGCPFRVRKSRRRYRANGGLFVPADWRDDSRQPVAGRGRRSIGQSHRGGGDQDSRSTRWTGGSRLGTGTVLGWGKMGAVDAAGGRFERVREKRRDHGAGWGLFRGADHQRRRHG